MKSYKLITEEIEDIFLLLQQLKKNEKEFSSVRITTLLPLTKLIVEVKFYQSITIVELRKIIFQLFGNDEMLQTLDISRDFTGESYFNIFQELRKEKYELNPEKWVYRS